MKLKILSILSAFVLFFSVAAMGVPAYAQSSTGNNGNFFSGLAQFIVNTFHLDQNQVQSAVNTYKTTVKANVQQNIQSRQKSQLDKLVSQGKITSSQEQAILNELSSLKSKYNLQNFKNMTPQQRQQQFQNERNDFDSWAKTQGIDPALVMPFGGMRGTNFGRRGFGRWGNRLMVSPTATPAQ